MKVRSDVDGGIRGLVATMNAYGFRTYASCQGHGFPVDRLKPYVAFQSSVSDAGILERALRWDAESPGPCLHWGWEVTASFNSEFLLCFRLHPTSGHHWWSRYWRRWLLQDFSTICRLIKSMVGELAVEEINQIDGLQVGEGLEMRYES